MAWTKAMVAQTKKRVATKIESTIAGSVRHCYTLLHKKRPHEPRFTAISSVGYAFMNIKQHPATANTMRMLSRLAAATSVLNRQVFESRQMSYG